MSLIFTVHDKEKCIICKESMAEMQPGRYTCLCCGITDD